MQTIKQHFKKNSTILLFGAFRKISKTPSKTCTNYRHTDHLQKLVPVRGRTMYCFLTIVQYIPFHVDFLVHTAVFPACLLEGYLGGHKLNIRESFRSSIYLVIAYGSWVLFCFFVTGTWPYGFIVKLGVAKSIILLVPIFILVAVGSAFVVNKTNSIFQVVIKTSSRNVKSD